MVPTAFGEAFNDYIYIMYKYMHCFFIIYIFNIVNFNNTKLNILLILFVITMSLVVEIFIENFFKRNDYFMSNIEMFFYYIYSILLIITILNFVQY